MQDVFGAQYPDKRELAKRWNVSVRTIDRKIAAGELKPLRFGPRILRFGPDEIARVEDEAAA